MYCVLPLNKERLWRKYTLKKVHFWMFERWSLIRGFTVPCVVYVHKPLPPYNLQVETPFRTYDIKGGEDTFLLCFYRQLNISPSLPPPPLFLPNPLSLLSSRDNWRGSGMDKGGQRGTNCVRVPTIAPPLHIYTLTPIISPRIDRHQSYPSMPCMCCVCVTDCMCVRCTMCVSCVCSIPTSALLF